MHQIAGRTEVAVLTATVGTIQQQLARQSAEDASRDRLLALTRQQQLESMLTGAKIDYYRRPTGSGHAYVCELVNQVNALRRQNNLPQLDPCRP